MSTQINEPWQTESDARIAAMEVALKVMTGELTALTQENWKLRELIDDAIPNMEQRDGGPFALAWVRDARAALNAATPAKPC